MRRAASRADWTAGKSRAISTPMIAITTSNSMSVNPRPRNRRRGPGMGEDLQSGRIRDEIDRRKLLPSEQRIGQSLVLDAQHSRGFLAELPQLRPVLLVERREADGLIVVAAGRVLLAQPPAGLGPEE